MKTTKENNSDQVRLSSHQHFKRTMSGVSPQTTTSPPPALPIPSGISGSGVLPPTVTTPDAIPNFTPLPPPPTSLESLRFQHLYTLALADRMRLLSPLWPTPRPLPSVVPPPGGPAPDPFSLPFKGLDPRYFGRPHPEEPKPQQSYIGLIAMAILSHPDEKLVLADIYQYILDNFPYFRQRGPGWRNSIRHNLSLNDCFIKAGRAANGKGHYWAIHTACLEDFKKGDFRRRKAQRKVRRHMGLAVDEEDSPSPPPPPTQGFFTPHVAWPPMPIRLPPPTQFQLPSLNPHPLPPGSLLQQPPIVATSSVSHSAKEYSAPLETTQTSIRVKRQFDMASLLKSEEISRKKDSTEEIVTVSSSNNNTIDTENEANEDSTSWRSVSPPQGPIIGLNSNHESQIGTNRIAASNHQASQSLMAHQYLARYYHLHLQHQSNPAAAAAAALAAAAAAASVNNSKSDIISSPRGSPTSPIIQERTF